MHAETGRQEERETETVLRDAVRYVNRVSDGEVMEDERIAVNRVSDGEVMEDERLAAV